jgi:hypothetical protein
MSTFPAETSSEERRRAALKGGQQQQQQHNKSRGSYKYPFDENGEAPTHTEIVSFPTVDRDSPKYNEETIPILLNAKEHAVGYLSRILNARVYEAAIETDLQHAKNLSSVRWWFGKCVVVISPQFLLLLTPCFNPFLLFDSHTHTHTHTHQAFKKQYLSQEGGYTARVLLQDSWCL